MGLSKVIRNDRQISLRTDAHFGQDSDFTEFP
jgi:hypothetical protein